MEKVTNFKNYKVWQDAVEFSKKVFQKTDNMPLFDNNTLCAHFRLSAANISSDIAEGFARASDAELVYYLETALGNSYRVETQLILANKVGYIDNENYQSFLRDIVEIEKQLERLIRILRQ